jgi:hypothetical protein
MTQNLLTALAGSVLAAGLALSGLGGDPGPLGPAMGQEKLTKQDFNGDGVVDMLTILAEGGSGFGGDFVTLKDGKTGRTFAYNTRGSYGQFLRLIPFDDELMKPKNKGFKAALEGALFSEIPQGIIDSSLAWLVDAYSRSVQESERPDDPLFTQKIRFEPRWAEGEIGPPVSYYLVTSDEALLRSYPIRQEDNPEFDSSHRQAWLVYYGHNHAAWESVPASGEVRVFKSAHGVVVSEGGRTCWAFVNDEVFADGPAKLRWPSIKDVRLSDGLLFIHHAGSEEHLYVVDYRAGVAGRLNPVLFPASGGSFEVRDRRLLLRGGPKTGAVDIGAIKTSLK